MIQFKYIVHYVIYVSCFLFYILQDKDIKVTFEDQQKINKFARNNARLQDLKEEMKNKTVHNEMIQ